jgi:hypothetical protein
VKALLFKMLPKRRLDDLPQGFRFYAFDGSSIQAPGATGTDYRLQYGLDLVTLEFTHLLVTDKHTGESLKNYPFRCGDVAVVDRGLCHASEILKKQSGGADVVARYNPAIMPLYKNDGTLLNIATHLKNNSDQITLAVSAKTNSKNNKKNNSSNHLTQLNGHLIVLRLSEKEAKAARKRCYRQASKKNRSMPSKDTLFLAGFLMVFTTLSPDVFSAQTVLELYRCRWQVEIAIKRLKSLLNIDQLRSKEGTTADLWLNGKERNALMLDRRMQKQLGDDWGHLNIKQRKSSKWRPLKLLKQQIEPIITGAQFWISSNWEDCLSVLFERPRRRKLQTLPKRAIKLFQLYSNTEVPVS